VLAMFHCVEQLILMDELANDEVGQTRKQDLPGVPQDTIDDTDDEDQNGLGQEESVAEDRGLDKFRIV
jgi:hypothetical protein